MRLELPLSRQGHPTLAHRFIGGCRHSLKKQPREGRQKVTPLRDAKSENPDASRRNLPSLSGLLTGIGRTPTVETVGDCRVSLPGQRPGNLNPRSRAC